MAFISIILAFLAGVVFTIFGIFSFIYVFLAQKVSSNNRTLDNLEVATKVLVATSKVLTKLSVSRLLLALTNTILILSNTGAKVSLRGKKSLISDGSPTKASNSRPEELSTSSQEKDNENLATDM